MVGYAGQNRRLWNPFAYDIFKPLHALNQWTSYAAFVLFFGQVLFIWNFFHSMYRGKKAEANPWQVGTLEWSTPSPPPVHNFDKIPFIYRGPHELSEPALTAKLGRDWVGQWEELSAEAPASMPASAQRAK